MTDPVMEEETRDANSETRRITDVIQAQEALAKAEVQKTVEETKELEDKLHQGPELIGLPKTATPAPKKAPAPAPAPKKAPAPAPAPKKAPAPAPAPKKAPPAPAAKKAPAPALKKKYEEGSVTSGGSAGKMPSLADFHWYHIVGLVVSALGLILAAGGGIGGGGLLVPIYIMVMNFSEKYGIPLSNVTILGGSIANNIFNMQKRHPNPLVDRPMIDYDLVLLMEPPTIAGAVLGSILNKILPSFVVVGLLVIVLGATAIKTWITGDKAWAKEQKLLEAGGVLETSESAPLVSNETKAEEGTLRTSAHDHSVVGPAHAQANLFFGGQAHGRSEEYRQLLEAEAVGFPLWKVGAILLCFLLVVACNLAKLQFATCGSWAYWAWMMGPVVISLSMSSIVRLYLLHKGEIRKSVGAPHIDGDCKWTRKTTITYPAICTLAGLFAGMFGIGGGIVKGPLMLEMGVTPEVSASTAAFMIFFTASSATVTYATFDQLAWDWAGILFCFGLIFTSLGQYVVNSYIKSTGRASIIVYIIATIVGLSTLLMGYNTGVISYHDIEANRIGFGSVCKKY